MRDLSSLNPIKSSTKTVLLVIVMFLMLFPFINSLNQLLVKVIEPVLFIKPLQDRLIPYETSLVRVILNFLRVPMTPGAPGAIAITLINKAGGETPVVVAWNCIGWQSLLVVLTTLFAGLTGKFSLMSKIEALVIGILGTFWLNIFRISIVFFLFYHINGPFAMAFHDYAGPIMTIIWVLIFWVYTFNFVLTSTEKKQETDKNRQDATAANG